MTDAASERVVASVKRESSGELSGLSQGDVRPDSGPCRYPSRFGAGETDGPGIVLRPVGKVVSPVTSPTDRGWGAVETLIVLDAGLAGGLEGLEGFSHVLVITYLHRAGFDAKRHLRRRPRGLQTLPLLGVFAQRGKDRPNPLGITCVPLLSVGADRIRVKGLDAINGTPVLDIKPFFPQFDVPGGRAEKGRAGAIRVPDWVGTLMEGYF